MNKIIELIESFPVIRKNADVDTEVSQAIDSLSHIPGIENLRLLLAAMSRRNKNELGEQIEFEIEVEDSPEERDDEGLDSFCLMSLTQIVEDCLDLYPSKALAPHGLLPIAGDTIGSAAYLYVRCADPDSNILHLSSYYHFGGETVEDWTTAVTLYTDLSTDKVTITPY